MNTKKQNKKKKGFTLIELIIVIAIIAILAAIAIPNFLSIQRKSRVKADIASAKTIYDATSALIAEGKIQVPESEATYKIDPTDNDATAGQIESYLQTMPKSESVNGQYFTVTISGDKENPTIEIKIDGTNVYPKAASPYILN
ncbi:prepilin-type N-terminal cleavage/methylation domain-containing protein [Clostridium perfringens]|uniref:prepilin-type N-terminal cleavage/methylation domain-containing protein n=1 Tax=Clostridium perfringens TaxID=1502 RepID=UPI0024BCC43B|nr:prepilin-type N-terminal cleavage/methylation domain-containing protein [Clostridium perfringens]ELC8425696.1 prepilin-type N-terminal cleavage/methylation domain-containing protein [Clostridium perfringens]